MAAQWPQGAAWPLDLREHATELTKYLRDTLDCMDHLQDQDVPSDLVKSMVTGTLSLINKTLRTLDLSTIQDALNMMKTEAKAASEESAKVVETVRVELRNNAADIKRGIKIGEETKTAAQKAAEKGNKVVKMVKEIKDKAPHGEAHGPMSYAAAAASGMLAPGFRSTHSVKAVSTQALRETIVSIRNPRTMSHEPT